MTERAVYRHADLVRVLQPRSIAIVGASPNATSYASITRRNLVQFVGPVYLVNGKYQRIGEETCYTSLRDLPTAPDCVVIAVGRNGVEASVADCIAKGAGGAVIYAAGFAETGRAEDSDLQKRILAMAREAGMRIIGPNVVGVFNHINKAALTFTADVALSEQRPFGVGLISQSGGMANGLTQALQVGVPISHSLSAGNSCDVDCADYLAYLADDPGCRAIALAFEGLASTDRLMQAGEIARRAGKPLVVCKLGRGAAGAAAAKSHTGFLAGTSAAYAAAFRRMGAIVVKDFHALMETAAFFAKAPPARGTGIVICSTSGGTVVHAADEAEEVGVALPAPLPGLASRLREHVPEFGTISNPCDITAAAPVNERLVAVSDLFLGDASYAALVNPHLYASAGTMPRLLSLGASAERNGKMVAVTLANEFMGGPGVREVHGHPSMAVFRSTHDCFVALKEWIGRSEGVDHDELPLHRHSDAGAKERALALLRAHREDVVGEWAAKRILREYGIPVVEEKLAASEDEALRAAQAAGAPVALKVVSPDIPHKTEAGVVRLGLKTAKEVSAAYREVLEAAATIKPAPKIEGVLVQPMVSGLEVMVGAKVDLQFGPLVLVGLGGILVELLEDTQLGLAPVGPHEARGMVERLKGQKLLKGFRGSAPVDVDRLVDLVVRVSELAADLSDSVEEIDINPVMCAGDRLIAVDALIIKAKAHASAAR